MLDRLLIKVSTIICVFLLMISSLTQISYASYYSELISINHGELQQEELQILEETLETYELFVDEFDKLGTSIDEQTDRFIEEDLQYFSESEAVKVKEGIERYRLREEDIIKIKETIESEKISEQRDNIKPNATMPVYPTPTGSDLVIANAAIVYFKAKNYNFSAHLLSRALYVRSPDEYIPSNSLKEFLYRTISYKSLSNKSRYPSGSSRVAYFENTFNRDEADAHYAINAFNARMTDNRVIITDTYDYAEAKNYNGPESVAINAIKRLQDKGLFISYPLRIHLVR